MWQIREAGVIRSADLTLLGLISKPPRKIFAMLQRTPRKKIPFSQLIPALNKPELAVSAGK